MSKQFFNDEEFVKISNRDLMKKLSKNYSVFERGRSLLQLARRSGKDLKKIELVIAQIQDIDNRNARTVGLVSIAHLGVAGLLEANTSITRSAANKLIKEWSEPDRSNLLDFLESFLRVGQG